MCTHGLFALSSERQGTRVPAAKIVKVEAKIPFHGEANSNGVVLACQQKTAHRGNLPPCYKLTVTNLPPRPAPRGGMAGKAAASRGFRSEC